jgi:hypothetical protein
MLFSRTAALVCEYQIESSSVPDGIIHFDVTTWMQADLDDVERKRTLCRVMMICREYFTNSYLVASSFRCAMCVSLATLPCK